MTLCLPMADIVERFHAGESVATLARYYGCHPNTLNYRLNQVGARTRKRARVNSRVMLATYKPVLVGLLEQLEKALQTVRDEFAANAGNPIRRKSYLSRIERLEQQVHVLQALTRR